jgi:hypothetical protein
LQGFTWAFNFVCEYGWQYQERSSVTWVLLSTTIPTHKLGKVSLSNWFVLQESKQPRPLKVPLRGLKSLNGTEINY